MSKKYASLMFQYGSIDDVLEAYVSDVAMLLLNKLPRHHKEAASIDHKSSSEVELDMGELVVTFKMSSDKSSIEGQVKQDPEFSFEGRKSRRGFNTKTFSIDSNQSGVTLVSQILNYLGTF